MKSPLKFDGNVQMPLKLKISVADGEEQSIYNLELPMKDQSTQFSAKVQSVKNLFFEFHVLTLFGIDPIAKGYLKLNQDNNSNETKYKITLVDGELKFFGELEFSTRIILPFTHPSMLIGGKIETYWKSTAIVPNTMFKQSKDKSMVTGTSLKDEFAEIVVQTTKDGYVVVYDDHLVELNGIQLPLITLTLSQLKKIIAPVDIPVLSKTTNLEQLRLVIKAKLITLEDILKV